MCVCLQTCSAHHQQQQQQHTYPSVRCFLTLFCLLVALSTHTTHHIPSLCPTPPKQDMSALQQGHGWWRLFTTAGLCHSGLISTWLCCAALGTCGTWLEAGSGQLQLLTIFLICTMCASAAHLFAGRCAIGFLGPGAVLGVYTTWCIVATQNLANVVPLRTIYTQGAMLLVLLLAMSMLQPAQSAASILGGMLGGAVAVKAAGPLSEGVRWGLALPAMAGLLLLKLTIDLAQVLWFAAAFVAATVYQMVADVVVTVKRL